MFSSHTETSIDRQTNEILKFGIDNLPSEDLFLKTTSGISFLMLFREKGFEFIQKYFSDKSQDQLGRSLVFWLIILNRPLAEIIPLISENTVNYKDKQGWTLLHLASTLNQIELIGILLDNKALISYTHNKESPRDLARKKRNNGVLKLLVDFELSAYFIEANQFEEKNKEIIEALQTLFNVINGFSSITVLANYHNILDEVIPEIYQDVVIPVQSEDGETIEISPTEKFGSHLLKLTPEILLYIFGKIPIEDLARVRETATGLHVLVDDDTFWKHKFNMHFSHLLRKIPTPPSWLKAFKKAYRDEYSHLNKAERRLFSLVKENDAENLKSLLTFKDFMLQDKNAINIFVYARRVGHPLCDLFYEVALKQASNGSIDTIFKRSLLHWACYFKQPIAIVDELLKTHNIDEVDYIGQTPLHFAVVNGDLNLIMHLIDMGADINKRTFAGSTLVYIAAQHGHLAIVRYLNETYPDLAEIKTHKQTTPLAIAAREGHLEVVKYLETKDNITASTIDGTTPLHYAACESIETVAYLVSKGNNVHAKTLDGKIPLYDAAKSGHLKIFEFLFQLTGTNDKEINSTALYFAACYGNVEIIKYLIAYCKKNIDVNFEKNKTTPIYIAAQNGHKRAVKFLQRHGANIDTVTQNGDTPALAAARNGNYEIVKYLNSCPRPWYISFFANPTPANNSGYSILHYAAERGDFSAVQQILETIKFQFPKHKISAFHLAAKGGYVEIMALLLAKDPDYLNHFSGRYYTALHFAAENGHIHAVKALLAWGADTNTKSLKSYTPVTIAAERGHTEVVRLLLQTNPEPCRWWDLSPRSLAKKNGHEEIVKILALYELQHFANRTSTNFDQKRAALGLISFINGYLAVQELIPFSATLLNNTFLKEICDDFKIDPLQPCSQLASFSMK